MPLHIYDGNWVVRKQYEADTSGMALRNLFDQTYYSPDPIIWVFDGKNAKAMRQSIYPGYKANRTPGTDDFYKTMNVFKDLLQYTDKIKIEVPGYEGDDMIASLVRQTSDTEILLHANDGDYHVLCNEKVKMTHPPAVSKVAMEDMRLYKTLVGDTSDWIPGIKGFGDTRFKALTSIQKETWVSWLLENPWTIAVPSGPSYWPEADQLGLSKTQYANFQGSWRALTSFWLIVGFVPLTDWMLQEHMTIGTKNYEAASKILRSLMQ